MVEMPQLLMAKEADTVVAVAEADALTEVGVKDSVGGSLQSVEPTAAVVVGPCIVAAVQIVAAVGPSAAVG